MAFQGIGALPGAILDREKEKLSNLGKYEPFGPVGKLLGRMAGYAMYGALPQTGPESYESLNAVRPAWEVSPEGSRPQALPQRKPSGKDKQKVPSAIPSPTTMDEKLAASGMGQMAGKDDQGRLAFEGPRIMKVGGRTVLTNLASPDASRIVNNSNVRADLPAYMSALPQVAQENAGRYAMERTWLPTDTDRATGPVERRWQGRTGGKTYDIGKESARRGGFFERLAQRGNENRQERIDARNRRFDLEERKLGTEQEKLSYEIARNAAIDPAAIAENQARAKYWEASASGLPNRETLAQDKIEAQRQQKILGLYAKLADPAINDVQKEELAQMIAILEAGGIPGYRKPQEAVEAKGQWNPFVENTDAIPAIPGGYYDLNKR